VSFGTDLELRIYPFKESDPFIIDHAPRLFAVGNQPRFADRPLLIKLVMFTL
jgi:DNA polymerase II small subunit/DNA polymerase delta subunit B